LLITDKRSTEV